MQETYYPTLKDFKRQEQYQLLSPNQDNYAELYDNVPDKQKIAPMIAKGYLTRTDGMPVEKLDEFLLHDLHTMNTTDDSKEQRDAFNRLSYGASKIDLTPMLYDWFNQNKNTFSYWFPRLQHAFERSHSRFFKIPETKFLTLPIELSQFMRIEYKDTDAKSRDVFNKLLFEYFELDNDKEYFIKTGTFSSKFEFRNAHLQKGEAKEIGEYMQVINNFAMLVGAGHTNDVVVREYIEDVENRPTIYHGMPLRTEFRVFIDCDENEIEGIVPYWNGYVMKSVLQRQGQTNPDIYDDYMTYAKNEDMLMEDFNKWQSEVKQQVRLMMTDLCEEFNGCWSLDIMKNGEDFYLIDMALSEQSAMYDLIDEVW